MVCTSSAKRAEDGCATSVRFSVTATAVVGRALAAIEARIEAARRAALAREEAVADARQQGKVVSLRRVSAWFPQLGMTGTEIEGMRRSSRNMSPVWR